MFVFGALVVAGIGIVTLVAIAIAMLASGNPIGLTLLYFGLASLHCFIFFSPVAYLCLVSK